MSDDRKGDRRREGRDWGFAAPFRHVFFRRQVRREIDEEIAFHLRMRATDNEALGMSSDEAERATRTRFGDPGRWKRECMTVGEHRVRERRRAEMFDELRQDVRYALRAIGRQKMFTAVILATLALGIGATTAIFSVVDGVLLRPLPFSEPDRLVTILGIENDLGTGSPGMSYLDYVDFADQNESFVSIAASSRADPGQMTLTEPGSMPHTIPSSRASMNLFETLGIQPVLGRGFLPEEDEIGGPNVVILGHAFWLSETGGDSDVIGQTISLDGAAWTIIGVMPEGFTYRGADLWLALNPAHADDSRGVHNLLPVARLQDGVTIEQATADVSAIAARLETEYPNMNSNRGAAVMALHERLIGNARPALLVLFGAVLVVLLIAATNVANLLLARAAPREREVAIRAALGAGRRRLVRQFLTESMVLSVLGGVIGVGVAWLGVRALLAAAPAQLPMASRIAVDPRVLSFALGLTLVTGVLCGLVPAFNAARPDLQGGLKEGSASMTQSVRRRRWAQGLVIFQVAFALVLVIASGLLLSSFRNMTRVDAGFDGGSVLQVAVDLPEARYAEIEEVTGFYENLIERVRAIPGVRNAAVGYMHPMSGGWETSFGLPGVFDPPDGERPEARILPVTPGYFQTVGMELLQGRDFNSSDVGSNEIGAVIINESFADKFFAGLNPTEHRLKRWRWWPELPDEYYIVGVVADTKMDGLDEPVPWAMYFPHTQIPFSDMFLSVRADVDPMSLTSAIREQIWAMDPALPVEQVATMSELQNASLAPERLQTFLIGIFAALALVLAAIGIFGVLSYSVSQRTGELGLRIALGASSRDVLGLVMGQGARLTAAGLVLGLLMAIGVTRLLGSLLFELSARDPRTFVTVTVVLGVVALAACAWPAVRASRTDPLKALRAE
jgi:predicted permease